MPPHISAPNHKDIALSQRHALGLSNLIQLIDPDLVPRVRRRSIPVRLLPLPQPVEQDAAACNPTGLDPAVRSVDRACEGGLVGYAVVVHACSLVGGLGGGGC
jgi:hypothetical protein